MIKFEIRQIKPYSNGHEVILQSDNYPLKNYLRRNLMGGTNSKWSHEWTFEDAEKVADNLATAALPHIQKFKMMQASLPSRWLYCEYGNHMYRAISVEGLSYLGPHDVNGHETCWPCYDGHFDCCYGATHQDYEQTPLNSKFRGLLKWQKRRDELKVFRRKNKQDRA